MLAQFTDPGEEVLSSGSSSMGDEKHDLEPVQAEKPVTSLPRISRPVFSPPRPDGGGASPAPRHTVPPLRPSATPAVESSAGSEAAEARASIVPPPLSGAPAIPGPPGVPASARPLTPGERARLLELESKVARSGREIVEAKAAQMRAECDRARAERTLRESEKSHLATLTSLRAELERAQQRNAELEARLLELDQLRERLTELEARLSAGRSSEPDDLKRLRGVGPAFERGLCALGITTFQQIADFTEEDIQRVARTLKVKPERIRRDDWVGSARALLSAAEKG